MVGRQADLRTTTGQSSIDTSERKENGRQWSTGMSVRLQDQTSLVPGIMGFGSCRSVDCLRPVVLPRKNEYNEENASLVALNTLRKPPGRFAGGPSPARRGLPAIGHMPYWVTAIAGAA